MHLIRPDHCRCVRSCQAQPELWRPDRFVALVSLLGILWLWRDTGDVGRIADHAQSTFWYVLPSLPMFLVLPAMLRAGVGFWREIPTVMVNRNPHNMHLLSLDDSVPDTARLPYGRVVKAFDIGAKSMLTAANRKKDW
jgi:hypothetical protein